MKTSDEIQEIAKALIKLQASMGPAIKGTVNPFFKSYYADLPSVWQAIREPLTSNELCVIQDATTLAEGVSITTRIIHSSGQWIEFGPLIIPLQKNDAQSIGSATSYGKRYSLGAALGVVSEKDDDGNKATKTSKKENILTIDPEVFLKRWESKFKRDDLIDYAQAFAQHYKIKISDSYNKLNSDAISFEKNISKWLELKIEKEEKKV